MNNLREHLPYLRTRIWQRHILVVILALLSIVSIGLLFVLERPQLFPSLANRLIGLFFGWETVAIILYIIVANKIERHFVEKRETNRALVDDQRRYFWIVIITMTLYAGTYFSAWIFTAPGL